jgi:biopolymer transport protein ExbD
MLIPETTKQPVQNDDNLIPLINVVFLMLIFFMVAGHIEKSDAVKTNPPQSISEQALQKQNIAELLVSDKRDLYLNGQAVLLEVLSENLTVLMQESKEIESFSVLVKVDESLAVSELKIILRNIKAAGILRITLVTQKQEATRSL